MAGGSSSPTATAPERAEHVRQLARERCQFGEILLAATGGIATVYANDGGVIAAY